METSHGSTPEQSVHGSSDEAQSEENRSSVSGAWSSQGFGELFPGDPDEMLVVHNTFLELCKMVDHGTIPADRFISAPAIFGRSMSPGQTSEPRTQPMESKPNEVVEEPTIPPEQLTTVMMRNIPTRTSAKILLDILERTFNRPLHEVVDFVYLPVCDTCLRFPNSIVP
jgi:hypothetical protein